MFEKGTIVTVGNRVGVVVFTGQDLGIDLEDHTGVWFGMMAEECVEVWTIPTEYLKPGPKPQLKH